MRRLLIYHAPILTTRTEDKNPQDQEGRCRQINRHLHHDSSYTRSISFLSALVACLFSYGHGRSVEASCLPSVLRSRFTRWVRFCDIVKAYACWTRLFWFWYLIFGCSAFGRGLFSCFAAAAQLCIEYLARRLRGTAGSLLCLSEGSHSLRLLVPGHRAFIFLSVSVRG